MQAGVLRGQKGVRSLELEVEVVVGFHTHAKE